MAFLCVILLFTMLISTSKSYSEPIVPQDKQSRTIDSLKTVIETADHACPEPCRGDTIKVKAINELAGKFITTKPDTAIELAKQALELSKTLEYIKGQIASYQNIGYVNYVQSDYEQARTNWQKMLELREQLGDKQGMAASYNNIGLIYWNQSDYPLALDYYFKSLKIEEELLERRGNPDEIGRRKQGIAMSYNNIGVIYENQSDYPHALDYYFKSLKIYEELGDKSTALANSYNNIGLIYWNQSDQSTDDSVRLAGYPLALDYYFKSLKIYEELGNKQGMAMSYTNIGTFYTSIYKQAQTLSYDEVDRPPVSGTGVQAKNNSAHLDTALYYQQKAFELQRELSADYDMIHSINGIGSIYAQKKDYPQALKHYQQAAMLADSINALNEGSSAHRSLAGIYEKIDNHKLALKHYKHYSTLKDSVFNEEKSKDIGKLEAKHEMALAETKRKQEEEERIRRKGETVKRRNILQYSGILIFLVVLGAGLLALGKLNIPIRFAEGIVFFSFLLFFEFTLVLLDPYIEQYSSGAPAIKLAFNAVLAALIFPLHSIAESKLKSRLFSAKCIAVKKRKPKPLLLLSVLLAFLSPLFLGGTAWGSNVDASTDLSPEAKAKVDSQDRTKTGGEQSRTIDSLENVLKTTKEDTTRVKILNNFVWEIKYTDPDTAFYYSNQALDIAKKAGWKKGIAISYHNLGDLCWRKGNYTMALDYNNRSLEIKKELNDRDGIVATLGNIGLVHSLLGDNDKALEYYFKALEINKETGNTDREILNLGNIGSLYKKQERYIEAERFLLQALELAKEIEVLNSVREVEKTLSMLYAETGQSAYDAGDNTGSTAGYKKAYEHYIEYSIANDNMFNEEKSKEMGKLEVQHEFEMQKMEEERIRKEELRIEKGKRQRRDNLQYSGILIFFVFLVIAILFSGKLSLPVRLVEGIVFFTFLLLFEFILVLLDPYIEHWITGMSGQAGGGPAYKLLINAVLAGVIFPAHQFFEDNLKKRITGTKSSGTLSGTRMILMVVMISIFSNLELLAQGNGDTGSSENIAVEKAKAGIPLSKADSLESLLRTALPDTARVDIMIMLIKEIKGKEPERAMQLADSSRALARESGYKYGTGTSLCQIAMLYIYSGEYDKAESYCHEAIILFDEMTKKTGKSTRRAGKTGIAKAENILGMVFDYKSEYDQAIKHYLTSLEMYEELGNKKGIASSLNNIGVFYIYQKDDDSALEYFLRSLAILKELGNKSAVASLSNNIGIIYFRNGEYAQAIQYFVQSLEVLEELGSKREIADCLGNIGSVYQKWENYSRALEYHQRSLKMAEELGDRNGMAVSILEIGRIYDKQDYHDKAVDHFQKSLAISKTIGRKHDMMEAYSALASSSVNKNNFKGAYEYFQLYTGLKDSLFNEEKSKEIGRLEAKHEMEMKMAEEKAKAEVEAKRKAEEENRRNNLQYSGILIFFVFLLIAISFSSRLALPVRLAEGVVFFTFLLFFEFCLVYLDPYIEDVTGGEPALKLAINAAIAALIFPLHSFFEGLMKKRILSAKGRSATAGKELKKE
ncbi:MAG: tetratricopeptide repeat protein [Bacteroidota bacterium]